MYKRQTLPLYNVNRSVFGLVNELDTNSAVNSYVAGQKHLHHYIEGLVGKQHGLRSYLSASSAFENCVGSIWKAAEVFDRMKRHVMSEPGTSLTVFTSGSNTDLERVNKINNTVKHFKPEQAEKSSAPIWITDRGLESLDASLDFEELYDNLIALRQVCRTIFVEIPTEARDLKEKQSKGSIPT